MTILKTKEDFENAILHGEEIKHETVFYTGELEATEMSREIGSYEPKYGIYAGMCNGKQIWLAMKDAPDEMNWKDAKKYCEEFDADCSGWRLPTKEELLLISANQNIFNAALKFHGGEELSDNYYWSSSPSYYYYCWIVNPVSGYSYYSTNPSYSSDVRPVLAL